MFFIKLYTENFKNHLRIFQKSSVNVTTLFVMFFLTHCDHIKRLLLQHRQHVNVFQIKYFRCLRLANFSSVQFPPILSNNLYETITPIAFYTAFKKLADYLQSEYMLHLRPNPGLSTLPDGLKMYQGFLEYHTSMSGSKTYQGTLK